MGHPISGEPTTRQFFARQRSDRVAVQLAAIAPSRFWHIATFRCGLTALVACRLGADVAAAARIPTFPAPRHSVVAARGLVASERDYQPLRLTRSALLGHGAFRSCMQAGAPSLRPGCR